MCHQNTGAAQGCTGVSTVFTLGCQKWERKLMKKYWAFVGILICTIQLTPFVTRAEETNTVEIIKQLQRRIEELEQKVKALEPPKPPNEEKEKERLEDLDQKV